MKSIVCVILTGILLTSCSTNYQKSASARYNTSSESSYSGDSYYLDSDVNTQMGKVVSSNGERKQVENSERKMIYDARISLILKNLDSINNQIEVVAKKYKGYISNNSSASAKIRVKSENLKEALEDLSMLGKVEYQSISGDDVTEQYFDFKIRLENAESARLRYLELLKKAEDVKAALLVEKELERLNGTIDMLKGKLSRMDHLEDYSTINIYWKEKKKPGVLGYIGLGVYHSVKWLFVRN